MDMEKVEKGLNNIYTNLGPTDLDKASAVAKGCFAALSVYTLGRAIRIPRILNSVVRIGSSALVGAGIGVVAFFVAKQARLPRQRRAAIAAATGTSCFLLFNSMMSSITIPITLTFFTAGQVGVTLGLAIADPDRDRPVIDQEFRLDLEEVSQIGKKIHLRAWLTGLTVGSLALMTDNLIRGIGVTSWSIKINELTFAAIHWGLSGLFVRAGINHIAPVTSTD